MIGMIGNFANPTADPATESLDPYVHRHTTSRLTKLLGLDLTVDRSNGHYLSAWLPSSRWH